MDGFFKLRLERRINYPLADLGTGFGKLSHIINIRFIQQFIDTLVHATLVKKQVKCFGRGGKTIRHGNTHTRKVSNHFTQRGIFAPDPVYIIHAELVVPKHQR